MKPGVSVAALAAVLLAATVQSARAGLLFGAPAYWTVAPGPRAVAVADIDDDGSLDVITANDSTNVVSVLAGGGIDLLAAPVTFATGSFPVALALVDFDADDRLDVVTADSLGNTASVLYGAGGIAFEPPFSLPTGAGPCAIAISPGFWGVAPGFETANASGTLTHFEADGRRNFFWRTDGTAGPNPCALVSLDMDWDGEGDAVVANGAPGADPGRLTLLFAEYEFYERYYYYIASPLAAAAVPRALALGEFLNTGWTDLMVASSGSAGGTISIYPGDGETPFGAPVTFNAGPPLSCFALVDMNLDEVPDIVTAGPTGSVAVLLNHGGGSFTLNTVLSVGEPVASVAAGDLDGDDWPDIVLALHESRRIAVLRGGEVSSVPGDVPAKPFALAVAPRPARTSAWITLDLPRAGNVRVDVQDAAGRLVRRLHDGPMETGESRITWDLRQSSGVRAAAGIYYVTVRFEGGAQSTPIAVIR